MRAERLKVKELFKVFYPKSSSRDPCFKIPSPLMILLTSIAVEMKSRWRYLKEVQQIYLS